MNLTYQQRFLIQLTYIYAINKSSIYFTNTLLWLISRTSCEGNQTEYGYFAKNLPLFDYMGVIRMKHAVCTFYGFS